METTKKRKKVTVFDVVVYGIAIILLIIVAYPLLLVLSCSISDPALVATGEVTFLPKGINFDGYRQIFKNPDILIGYGNSIFYTVAGTLVNLVVTVPAGYVLTKKIVPGNKLFMTLFMITMYFSGGLIPTFLLVNNMGLYNGYVLTKKIVPGNKLFMTLFMITMYFSGGLIPTFLLVNNMGLYNTRFVLLILGAFNCYNCIICRSFFAALPKELEEAAEIDGCSPITTFIKIVLPLSKALLGVMVLYFAVVPLSKALLGVMVLYFAVVHWNSYFNGMVYIKDDALQPLQVFLRRMLVLAQMQADMDAEAAEAAQNAANLEALMRYAVIVVSSLPLLIIYPFLQKYFDKGVLIGSVKG